MINLRIYLLVFYMILNLNLVQAQIIEVSDKFGFDSAIADANPLDTIMVMPGEYVFNKPLKIEKPIVIASRFILSKNEEDIKNTRFLPSKDDLHFWIELTAKDVKLIGFTFIGSKKHTLNIAAEYASVIYCRFIGGNDQLSFSGGGGYVGYCYFDGAGDDAIDCDESISWVIEHNTIINAYQDGIEIRLHPKEGPLSTHVFRHNYVFNSGQSGIQLIDYENNSYRKFFIHHNIFEACKGSGLSCMYKEKDNTNEVYRGSLMLEKAIVYNNTFSDCNYGLTLAPGLTVLNNIFTKCKTKAIERGIYLNDTNDLSIVDHCLFFNNRINFSNSTRVGLNNYINKNPHLDKNLRLEHFSKCIDNGVYNYKNGDVVIEIECSEYLGDKPDLGAIEYQ